MHWSERQVAALRTYLGELAAKLGTDEDHVQDVTMRIIGECDPKDAEGWKRTGARSLKDASRQARRKERRHAQIETGRHEPKARKPAAPPEPPWKAVTRTDGVVELVPSPTYSKLIESAEKTIEASISERDVRAAELKERVTVLAQRVQELTKWVGDTPHRDNVIAGRLERIRQALEADEDRTAQIGLVDWMVKDAKQKSRSVEDVLTLAERAEFPFIEKLAGARAELQLAINARSQEHGLLPLLQKLGLGEKKKSASAVREARSRLRKRHSAV